MIRVGTLKQSLRPNARKKKRLLPIRLAWPC